MVTDRIGTNISKPATKPTVLQRIATRRNWLLNFTLQHIHIRHNPDLKLSRDTVELADEINGMIDVLKARVDRDWKNQRRAIKRTLKRLDPMKGL